MRLIYGSPMRGEVLNIQRRCGLYTGAANTRVYTVDIFNDGSWVRQIVEILISC